MSDDDGPDISRPMQIVIVLAVFVFFVLAIAAAAVLVRWLPLMLKPLALVPIMLLARYGIGKTWVESGCLVGIIGGFTALGVGVMKLIRTALQS